MTQSQSEKIKDLQEKIKIKELESKLASGPSSKKEWFILFICWFLFGLLGVHRFYAGRIVTGIIWALTCGCFGIGYLIDFVLIITGNFRDSDRRKIPYKQI